MTHRKEFRADFREVYVIIDHAETPDLTVTRFDLSRRDHPVSPKPSRPKFKCRNHKGRKK